jgi:HSP20 family molecular chaperone IbpA
MIRKIKPVARVIKIQTEVDRIKRAPVPRRDPVPGLDEIWLPLVDVCEKPREIVVEAEMPGVSQADIMITVQSNRVEITGTKRDAARSQNVKYLRLEREFGRFRRLVALPCTVVPDRARAFLANGVLTIQLFKYLPPERSENENTPRKDDE